jgi:hypothetical protein
MWSRERVFLLIETDRRKSMNEFEVHDARFHTIDGD